jgi:predicted DNA-binding protein
MTDQYKLRLKVEVIERLEQMAQRYGRRSGNRVAAEVIDQYLDFWEYAEQAKQAVLEEQRAVLVDPIRVPVLGNPKMARKQAK